MQNAGLDEAQAGIKIARRNTSNLRYADSGSLQPAKQPGPWAEHSPHCHLAWGQAGWAVTACCPGTVCILKATIAGAVLIMGMCPLGLCSPVKGGEISRKFSPWRLQA